jgi:heme exporter protein A
MTKAFDGAAGAGTGVLDFSGARVVVVGGSSGIGNGIARAFLDRGASVTVWGTRATAADYASEAGSDLSGLDYVQVDVASDEAVALAAARLDRLDVLVLSQGKVLWRGLPTQEAGSEFKRELLYLGHALGLKDELTALENVQLNAAMAGQTINHEKALQALATQGLKSRAHLPLRVLSQGQKRRVALARLQVAQAKLWLLDEPFVALDADAVQALQGLLQQHVAQGGALVFTSHQTVNLGAAVQSLRLQA